MYSPESIGLRIDCSLHWSAKSGQPRLIATTAATSEVMLNVYVFMRVGNIRSGGGQAEEVEVSMTSMI